VLVLPEEFDPGAHAVIPVIATAPAAPSLRKSLRLAFVRAYSTIATTYLCSQTNDVGSDPAGQVVRLTNQAGRNRYFGSNYAHHSITVKGRKKKGAAAECGHAKIAE
jgi:hypothetical protein